MPQSSERKFIQVVFPLPVNHPFTYSLPDDLRDMADVGRRVLAPFGARHLTGFIVDFTLETDLDEVKEIYDVLDLQPLINSEMMRLARWIADYYFCSLGEALKVMIPAHYWQSSKQVASVTTNDAEKKAQEIEKSAPRQAQILRYLAKSKKISVNQLKKKIGAKSLVSSLTQLQGRGLVNVEQQFLNSRPKPKVEKYVKINWHRDDPNYANAVKSLPKNATGRLKCVEYLAEKGCEVLQKEVLQATGASLETLKTLSEKGLISFSQKEVLRDFYISFGKKTPGKIVLNVDQKNAVEQIKAALTKDKFASYLLYGVTGSGKTQVYIEAIADVLQKGKGAIVLVPEIALTPQTVARFRHHFKDQVAVLHSAMSTGERYDSWRKIRQGNAKVVIGPRSAVFAPLKNIGLIVVDEEHEGSYKQSDSAPRYHARDVAVVRAKQSDAVVVLGSATPSTESFHNAQIGKYHLLQLPQRVNDVPMPEVTIIDMIKEKRLSGKKDVPVFSRLLIKKIEEKIKREEQTILLLNRRGFSSYIKCTDCGFIDECEQCSITLTYHLPGRRLRCHYCGFTKKAPTQCPDCMNPDIIFRGYGTQKVERELQTRLPQARVVRMDLDTTVRKHSHDRILRKFENGEYDILLGTQMVAKGLDFNKVTLVGVINADIGMLVPDFRSSERTFQLLTQVAGRAGRRELTGEVIIQTFAPDSFCLRCARNHDFLKFFNGEITDRQNLIYPPFGRIICLIFKGEQEAKVSQAAQEFANVLKRGHRGFLVLGPTPAAITKIQNKYRYQLLMKADKNRDPSGKNLRHSFQRAQEQFSEKYKLRGVRMTIDVDPISIV